MRKSFLQGVVNAAETAPPSPKVKPSLCILTPTYAGCSPHYVSMLIELTQELRTRGHSYQYKIQGGMSFLQGARNALVGHLLASTCDYGFFIDSDMAVSPEVIFRMLAACETGDKRYVSCAGSLRDIDGKYPSPIISIDIDPRTAVDSDGCIEVNEALIACALIHRSVFTKMIDTGHAEPYEKDGTQHNFFGPMIVKPRNGAGPTLTGEDHAFSIRATMAGIRQHVLVDADVYHAGVTINLARSLATYARAV